MTRIKLKESMYLLKESEDVYLAILTGTRKIKRFKVDDLVKETLGYFKKEENLSEVVSNLSNKYEKEDVMSCINSLRSFGLLLEYDSNFNPRYERQISFINELTNSWEEALTLQSKIENSKIAVFGVGGIGTWIVNGLSQIGVKEIRISDPDTVSLTNLNRQLHYNSEDVGRYKVDVLKEKVPDSKIIPHKKMVSEKESLDGIIEGCNFMINCADSPSVEYTTRVLSKYARDKSIPYSVAGGYNMHLGMVGPIIIPGKTACFDCFLHGQMEQDSLSKLEKIKDIETAGNLGPIAGAVANLQVMEIFKFLTNKGTVNFNKFAEIDFLDLNIAWKSFNKRRDCKTCNS